MLRTECERIFGEPDSDAEEREDTASASEPSEGPTPKRQRSDDGFVVYEGFRSFGRANPTVLPVDEPLAVRLEQHIIRTDTHSYPAAHHQPATKADVAPARAAPPDPYRL